MAFFAAIPDLHGMNPAYNVATSTHNTSGNVSNNSLNNQTSQEVQRKESPIKTEEDEKLRRMKISRDATNEAIVLVIIIILLLVFIVLTHYDIIPVPEPHKTVVIIIAGVLCGSLAILFVAAVRDALFYRK